MDRGSMRLLIVTSL